MTSGQAHRLGCAIFVAAAACGSACGGKKDDASSTGSGDGSGGSGSAGSASVAPIAMPPTGIDKLTRLNYGALEGQPAYMKAVGLYKAKARDWAAIRAQCEAAIAKDPSHLDAHRLLGTALAQLGEHAAAVDHLVAALAADYYKYGPSIESDDELKDFLATPHGTALKALAAKIAADYAQHAQTGLWLVARRWPFKGIAATGVQGAESRGDLYAFDRETKRYYKLTHTDQVVGFVRAPADAEVAVIGFDKLDRSKDAKSDAPPLLARSWVQVYDTKEWKPQGARVVLGSAREISVGYGAGDQLLVSTAAASGRWTVGDPSVSSIDRTSGKLTKVASAPPEPRVALTIEEGRLVRAADGVKATWAGEPKTASAIETASGAKIAIPESGVVAEASLAVAPQSGRIAFATYVDPCAKDTAPSLYVADGKTGQVKHVLSARSRFATRWVDPNMLAYEDGDGAIRLWDATSGREAMKIDNKSGLALDVLSLESAPLCKQAPPVVEPAGSGSGSDGAGSDALPPEDGSAATNGPITQPGSN
jgi:hypothetical protein